MTRIRAEQILSRVLEQIEKGCLPVKVRECYVFGSYAAGSVSPGDIDLILVHDKIPHSGPWWTTPRPAVVLGKVLRKPGEKMDIVTGTSLSQALMTFGKIKDSPRVLLWSEENRNWRKNLAEIPVDPAVRRHDRNHFADLKRFNGTALEMESTTEAQKLGFLKLERIDLAAIELTLNPLYRKWNDYWASIPCFGRDTLRTLEFGMWWVQQQKGQATKCPGLDRCELVTQDGKYVALLGRPPLWRLHRFTDQEAAVKRICMIPHFKRDYPKEAFVFERGECWDWARYKQFTGEFDLQFGN